MTNIIELRNQANFDSSDQRAVAESVAHAINGLQARAETSGAEVIWSTLGITFDVRTIEEKRLVDYYPIIRPGKSEVSATVSAITR